MEINQYIVRTYNGKVSWKKTAENLLEILENYQKNHEMGWKCPKCGKKLLGDRCESEIFCEDENCSFDKIVIEVMYTEFMDKYNIEELEG